MYVYVNWETQEVVGVNQANDIIDQKFFEYLDNDDFLEDYLLECFSLEEIWHMDTKQKEKAFEEYTFYLKEQAKEWFDDEFCAYSVE